MATKTKAIKLASDYPYVTTIKYDTPQRHKTLASAKSAALKRIDELVEWCKVYNRDGLSDVLDFRSTVGSLTDADLPLTVSEVIDSYSGVRFECHFDKERT